MIELNADWMMDELETPLGPKAEALIAQTASDLALADWFLEDENALAQMRALLGEA